MLFYSFFFFFKQKTAYEMRISDWSSDVCSSDLRLAEDLVDAVAGGENARSRGAGGAAGGDDVALVVHLHRALEYLGGRIVADGDEDAVAGQLAERPGLGVAQAHAGDAVHRAVAAQDVVHHGVPAHRDLGVPEQAVLADLLGAQGAAAVDQGHLVADVGEVERLLHGGVAAADHHDLLAAVEEDRKSVV